MLLLIKGKETLLEKSQEKNNTKGFGLRPVLSIGISLSLTLGFIDVALSLFISEPSGLSKLLLALIPSIATAYALFLVYIFLYLVLALTVAFVFRLNRIALAFSMATFIGVFFLSATSVDLFHVFGVETHLMTAFLLATASLIVALPSYLVGKQLPNEEMATGSFSSFLLASPLISAEFLLFTWIWIYVVRPANIQSALLPCLGLVVLVLLTLMILNRYSKGSYPLRALIILMVIMALNPLLALSYLGDSRPKTQNESYSEKKIQHVIVVSIDTLRQDFLSCYGDPGGLSPQIDQLAEDGLLFQDAYSSSPWTLPSFSSIFTGVSPKVQ